MEDIIATIQTLNNARLGSFAEYVFGTQVPGAVRGGGKGADFDVPGLGRRVDVKASCRFIRRPRPTDGALPAVGQSGPHEIRANVVFFADCVSVHYDDAPIATLTWNEVQSLFEAWLDGTGKTHATRQVVAPHDRERGLAWNLWHIKAWAAAITETGRPYSELSGKEREAIVLAAADAYERAHPDDADGGIRNTLALSIVFGKAKTMRPTWINIRLYMAAYLAGVYRSAELNERLLAMLVRGALHPEGKALRATLDATLADAGYSLTVHR